MNETPQSKRAFEGNTLRPATLVDAKTIVARFALTFVLTTGFFALDMALFQPRYPGIFPQLLRPRLPF
jgi:hypothetical protein